MSAAVAEKNARVQISEPQKVVMHVTIGADSAEDITDETLAELGKNIQIAVRQFRKNGLFEKGPNELHNPELVIDLRAPAFDHYAKQRWFEKSGIDAKVHACREVVERATLDYAGRKDGSVASTSFNGKW